MTDYTNLLELLRLCSRQGTRYGYAAITMADAADAIEELQQIADHHEQTAKDYWKEACDYKSQIPKHGEWKKKYDSRNWYHWYVCSECGNRPPKDIEGFSVLSDFCPSCGAKMGVQDADNRTEREKKICDKYSQCGVVRCNTDCPLIINRGLLMCKANSHYDRHTKEYEFDEMEAQE